MSVIIADIITEHGAYFKVGGQGTKELMTLILQGSVTEGTLAPIRTDKTKIERSSAEISSVLQAFQKQFTQKGDSEFKPLSIELQKLKIDVEEYPDDIEQSWLGFLASEKLDRKSWPFVRYWLQELVLKKAIENWELNEVYFGKYVTPVSLAANPDGFNFDGIRYKINKGISDGDIIVIPSGAWTLATPATFVTEIEDWVKLIPSNERRHIKSLNMSEDMHMTYRQGKREKYNMNYAQETDSDKVIDTVVSVVGLPSMSSENKIWCTVTGNANIATKKPGNERIFKVEEAKRLVSAMTDYYKGFGFWLPQYVYTNDLNLGSPQIDNVAPLAAGTAGGTTIVVTGRGFNTVDSGDSSAVLFDAADATSFTIDSDTQITFVSPAIGAGSYNVSIVNEFGTTVSSQQVVVS